MDIQSNSSGSAAQVAGGGTVPSGAAGMLSDGGAASGTTTEGGVGTTEGGDPSTSAGAPAGGAPGDCAGGQDLVANTSPTAPGPLACSVPGALVCDDFEDGQLPYWTVWLGPPAFGSLQGCLVHRGARSLLVQTSAPNQVQILQPLATPVAAGSLFLRSFVYLPAGEVLADWTVLYEIWDSPTSASDKISLDLHADGSLRTNNSSAAGRVESLSTGAITLPRDRWTCLELEVLVDRTNGAIRIHMDDAQVAATALPQSTRGNQAFSTVLQGANVASGSLRLYWDDFVVATERVGCQ